MCIRCSGSYCCTGHWASHMSSQRSWDMRVMDLDIQTRVDRMPLIPLSIVHNFNNFLYNGIFYPRSPVQFIRWVQTPRSTVTINEVLHVLTVPIDHKMSLTVFLCKSVRRVLKSSHRKICQHH